MNAVVAAGIGTAFPDGTISSAEFAELACRLCARVPRDAALVHAVVRQSGIDLRHSVLSVRDAAAGLHRVPFYENRPAEAPRSPSTAERMAAYALHAPPLAAAALRRALENANVDSGSVTHLVVASCTGFFSPGIDIALIDELKLPTSISRTLVGFMGCHGAVNALAVAAQTASMQRDAVAAVVAVELCTLHFQFELGRDALLPNALFGDGAGAIVFRNANNPCEKMKLRFLAAGSALLPDSRDAMTWTIGDAGFRMTLDSSVPDRIRAVVGATVDGFLARHGLRRRDIRHWAIHPGGPRVLDACVQALAIDEARAAPSREFLRRAGNISSASILHILNDIAAAPEPGPVLAIAFGPGLVAEMALLEKV